MEIEKRIWDMQRRDYLNVFLRFWIVIALVATIAGGAFFVFGYYDRIINENYTSKVEYQFLYVVETPNPGDASSTGKLADPAIYVNVYKKWYTDLDVLKTVESVLLKNMEKDMHYSAADIKRMTETVYLNFNLTISLTTKRAEHSQEILKLIQQFAEPKINDEVQRIKDRDSGDIEINSIIAEPGLGINYESEEEVLTRLIVNFGITFLGVFIVLYGLLVVIVNFDGKFKRHDVFENNYQIPVLGEISVKMYKE